MPLTKGFELNQGGQFKEMFELLQALNNEKMKLQADPTQAVLSGFSSGFRGGGPIISKPPPNLGRGFTQLEQLLNKLFQQTFLDANKGITPGLRMG
jgi:hypothetical protein